ncbi:MAG: hypothetical protein ABI663_20280, partial [Chryseolinea sp.]
MKFRIILFLSGFLFLHTVTNAQTVTTVTGSYCVGSQTVFVLVGSSCSSYSWSVSSGTNGIDYTITGSSNAQAYQVNWLRPISGNVRCSYVCNGSSGAAYSSNFTISNKVAPSVSISSNVGTTACQGSSVTFTATPTNGGTSPNYNWRINGTTISSGSSNTFVRTNLVNGDIVSVVLSSNFTCLTTTTATSNSLTMTITQPSPVTVTVTGSSIICSASSTNSSFVASATNTGSSPVYTWYKNGGQVTGASGPPPYVYVPQTALANGDKITCKVTSNASCISGNPATSNEYVVSLTTSVTPSVGIPITKLVYCTGEIMSLTASSSYLTGSSTYSWKLNGTQFATTSSTTLPVSTDINAVNTFSPGDVVTVSVTGLTGTCLTATTATGSTSGVPFVIGSPPSVTIDPSGNWSMSSQSTMDITATSGLSYQWKRDGLPISPGGNVNPYTATMSGAYTVVGTSNGCSRESNTLNLRKNTIPIANAGPDITTNPAQPLVMAGSGTDDDGLLNSTTISGLGPIWTQISGPTTVIFDNIQSYTPTV